MGLGIPTSPGIICGPERHLVSPHAPAHHDGGEGVDDHKGRIDGPFRLNDA